MRIGAHVFGYSNAQEWALLHKKLGYGAAYWPLALDAPERQVEEYAAEARHHDLLISEIGAWNNMLAADPDEAERNVQANIDALRLADRVGARCCINITGSLSDTWDGPHPKTCRKRCLQRRWRISEGSSTPQRLKELFTRWK